MVSKNVFDNGCNFIDKENDILKEDDDDYLKLFKNLNLNISWINIIDNINKEIINKTIIII